MKPRTSPHDQEILELLKSLQALKAEYPAELLSARRAAFVAQIDRYNGVEIEEIPANDEVVKLLGSLKPVGGEYPAELMTARRAAFIAQIKQRNEAEVREELASEDQVVRLLEGLKTVKAQYPAELLSARRAAFIAQIERRNGVEIEEIPANDEIVKLLGSLKPVGVQYPAELMAARRAAFIAQIEKHNHVVILEDAPSGNGRVFQFLQRSKSIEIEYPLKLWNTRRAAFLTQVRDGRTSILDALRSAVQSLFDAKVYASPGARSLRASLVVAGFVFAAFVGTLLYGNRAQVGQLLHPSQSDVAQLQPAATETGEAAEVTCKPGYLPPLCLVQEVDQSETLTFPGNGTARPAVAKDTVPGYRRIHKASYANDGLYGPGASWVSNSAFSWIKIDLGKVTSINTITFGRDRLGKFNDGDPGQFFIAVATSDDIYADGNSNNDFAEYTQVYNSEQVGFDGIISGPETIKASFKPVIARFVKITFENPGAAVDEIEAFMIQPPGFVNNPTEKPRDDQPRATFTSIPTNTLMPSRTPTDLPTDTPLPTRTHTPLPTSTSTATTVPTDTPTDVPTNTPLPTSTPPPTSTPMPTSTPPPTSTPIPTSTPVPINSPVPIPTDTAEFRIIPTETSSGFSEP